MTTLPAYDFSTAGFWALPHAERLEHYRDLRDNERVSWHGSEERGDPKDFWAVTRFDDVREVSRDPERFCSAQGVAMLPDGADPTPEELGVQSFLVMDDPDHKRLRGLVQAAFTPRRVKQIDDQIVAHAKLVVDDLESNETGDVVERVAMRLPLITICRLLEVPDDEHEEFLGPLDDMAQSQDPEWLDGRDMVEALKDSILKVAMYAFEMAGHRRANPGGEDLVSGLAEVEFEGHKLTDAEIAQFVILLGFAGNDTTRNTTSHAMKALCDNPDRPTILQEDPEGRLPVAIDEFVRYASPVQHFLRTATRDTEIGGQAIEKDQRVVMLYTSANWDERAIPDPDHFDVTRDPNRHCGFGGGGPHFCLGSALARVSLRALFTELLTQFPQLEVGEPRYIISNFIDGIGDMPMAGPTGLYLGDHAPGARDGRRASGRRCEGRARAHHRSRLDRLRPHLAERMSWQLNTGVTDGS